MRKLRLSSCSEMLNHLHVTFQHLKTYSQFYSVMKLQVLVILVSFCSSTFAQKYVITRRTAINGQIQPDLVQIPPSLCHNNGTTECSMMDGQRHSKICQCVCDKERNFQLYKTTFAFYDGKWICGNNTAVRRLSGCLLSLYDFGGLDDTILTIPSSTPQNYPIANITTGYSISLADGETCSLRAENSMYLKCNGKWEHLNSALVIKKFHINYEDRHIVYLWVNNTEGSSYPLLSGRIIRLAVTCSDRPWESSQCIVAKVQGQLDCSVSSPPPITSVLPPTKPPSTSLMATTSLSQPSTSLNPVPNIKNPDKDSSTAVNNTLIIGVTLGGIAISVALIILAVVIIAKWRKRRLDGLRKASASATVIENESYGEIVANSQKQKPRRAEEQQTWLRNGRHMEGHEHSEDDQDEVTTEEEPLYQAPESIIYENNATDEPLYNVLQETKSHGTPYGAPTVYGTFDEPNKEGTSDNHHEYEDNVYDSVGDIMRE